MQADSRLRLLSIDVIRGIAVMGIALMNVASFAMYSWGTVLPQTGGGTDPLNMAIWALEFVFIEHKMRGLFSLLFGASLLLYMQSAERSGLSPKHMARRRLLWLLLLGVLHIVLLWAGDILAFYALVGFIAILFSGLRTRTLLACAALAFAGSALVWCSYSATTLERWQRLNAPDTPAHVVTAIAAKAQKFTHKDGEDIAAERDQALARYVPQLKARVSTAWDSQKTVLRLYFFETLGLMLLGMAMLKGGFFGADAPPPRLRRIANVSGFLGVGGMSLLLVWIVARKIHPLPVLLADLLFSLPFRLAIIIAYAALIALWCRERKQLSLKFRLAETGQMAFTNYIATSLLFALIFYGYGLGLYGMMDRFAQLLVVIGVCALMLVWSPWWMARFHHGPLEWLWRCLTRWEPVPIRRNG